MKTFNGDQKIKLTQIINEGMQVMHEVDTLSAGLNDTIKAIAEELEIKPAVLKKAIKLAHKAEFGKAKQDHEQLETILETVARLFDTKFCRMACQRSGLCASRFSCISAALLFRIASMGYITRV